MKQVIDFPSCFLRKPLKSLLKLSLVLVFFAALPGIGQADESKALTVLNYNIYLLYPDVNSRATMNERLALLPNEIAKTEADIIFIQELWGKSDRRQFVQAMQNHGYTAIDRESRSWWPPYFLGNGLLILVKNAIQVRSPTQLVYFPRSIGSDGYTRKGVIGVTVDVPEIGAIDLFNAHTSFLPFDLRINDFDLSDQNIMLDQMQHIGDMISSFPSPFQIFAADLNTHPYVWDTAAEAFDPMEKTPEYAFFTEDLGLMDTYYMALPSCHPHCSTWDNEGNLQIQRSQRIDGGTELGGYAPSSRIDYIFVRGEGVSVYSNELAMTAEFDLTIRGRSTKESLHLSDHFGWLSVIEFPTAAR